MKTDFANRLIRRIVNQPVSVCATPRIDFAREPIPGLFISQRHHAANRAHRFFIAPQRADEWHIIPGWAFESDAFVEQCVGESEE